ncbi:MAG: LTA synthase family protein [Xanthomonadales bacterium]|nr:LTA synthase family protein [Xanthomonadales bacterium]
MALSVLLLMSIILVFVRAWLVNTGAGRQINCTDCFTWAVINADARLFLILAGLLWAGGWFARLQLYRLFHLAAAILLFAAIADVMVYQRFNTRLFLVEATNYVQYYDVIWDQLISGAGGLGLTIGLALLILAVAIGLQWIGPIRDPTSRRSLVGIMVLAGVTASLPLAPDYVNSWAYRNVLAANLASSDRQRYTDETTQRIQETAVPPQCIGGLDSPERRNVVMVIIESWSPYHSQLESGIHDWTPALDRLAARGQRFTAFHAGGFSTNEGLVGILAGVPIWVPFVHLVQATPFLYQWGITETLPVVFNKAGYHTAFLTSGPLSFAEKDRWLRDIGFAELEDGTHPHYQNKPRFSFGAPADNELYARALSWQSAARTPYFLVVETVTTHQPYIDPVTRKHSLEAAIRFADQAAADYVHQLDAMGFFEDGLLVLLSDHRAMTPMLAEELDALGTAAYSRVPMLILDPRRPPGEIDALLQQSDLVPSFSHWLGLGTCLDSHDDLVFAPGTNAGRCTFHARGAERGLMDVICPEGQALVRLSGDSTHFLDPANLSPGRQQALLDFIARERITALSRHEAHESRD